MLVPQPETELRSVAVKKVWNPNHWTVRQLPRVGLKQTVMERTTWQGTVGGLWELRTVSPATIRNNPGNNQGAWPRTPELQMGSLVAQPTDTLIST